MDQNIQITDKDIGEVLVNSAMLVAFYQSTWTGEASDSSVVDDAKKRTGAKGKVGSFRKFLLANNDEAHAAVKSAIGAAYRDHMKMTLPWGNSQHRLLPNARFMDYAKTMQEHRTKVQIAVDAFIDAYPAAMAKAISDLAGMADASEYPTAEEAGRKFSIDIDFMPMSGSNGFRGLPPQFAEALQVRMDQQIKLRMKEAIDNMWGRIKELVTRYVNQCRPDGKIYDTTTEAMQKLPADIRAFNVTGDAQLEVAASMIEKGLAPYGVKDLAIDGTRAWCHAEATKILGMLP